ncbi:MAG: hypothetical protein AYK19_16225 [Theionarchaea archaeon DG-70-1]|nr:MAG: hypothetical protein AYK19_16225 [Theionarchaea archaeon DG-70-1]
MVKAKKKKKKKRKKVEEKPSRNMFAKGGLSLLALGGLLGIFCQTLYFLITVETQTENIEEISYRLFLTLFEELGMLFMFFALVFACFFFLKEKEFFQKYAGSALVTGGVLLIPAVLFSLYDSVSVLKDQTITARAFVITNLPGVMTHVSKVYLFAGALLLGIYLLNRRNARKWAAAFFLGGCAVGSIALAVSMYSTYDSYIFLLEMYGEPTKDTLISQFLFPDLLRLVSWFLIMIGGLFLSAFYIRDRTTFRKWAGRTWVFGGIAAAFYGFLRLGMESRAVRNEITSVRQSIMELTPYSTSLKDQILTIETLREFYVKKMMPLYLENAWWIAVFAGIAVLGIFWWVRER